MRSIYELWMEQSQEFFKTADQHMQGVFKPDQYTDPEAHLDSIQAWVSAMKEQWQTAKAAKDQQDYWNMMTKVCSDAADLMIDEWRHLAEEGDPVKSLQELYQLWLNCCNEVYMHLMQTDAYQDAYGEFMNRAFQFWKNAVPTN